MGHSTSLKMAPFDRSGMVSYSCMIVSCTVCEI